jgi:hypothetical protein
VTPSDDLSPPRRPIFFPVVIATVFLTIIGMTAGFMLGERHRNEAQVQETTPPTEITTTTSPTPSLLPTDGACPDEAEQTAVKLGFPSDLRQVFKVITDNGTTVWICQDPQGSLYYQSKTGGVDAPLRQGKNGLFLSSVVRRNPDEYEAMAAEGNRFVVSRERLEVHFTDGRADQTYKVVRSE